MTSFTARPLVSSLWLRAHGLAPYGATVHTLREMPSTATITVKRSLLGVEKLCHAFATEAQPFGIANLVVEMMHNFLDGSALSD